MLCSLFVVGPVIGQDNPPKERPVPDTATAIKVAESALIRVYGKKKIESERPFTAKLEKDVWTASGTLHCPDGKGGITTHCVGGAAEVKISKIDGHIIRIVHYKQLFPGAI